jgi:hypothetical protein
LKAAVKEERKRERKRVEEKDGKIHKKEEEKRNFVNTLSLSL